MSFVISLLLHLLIFLLLAWISPGKEKWQNTTRIVTLVPPSMFSNGAVMNGREARLQVPVFVRPFSLPGDGRPGTGNKGDRGKKKESGNRRPVHGLPQVSRSRAGDLREVSPLAKETRPQKQEGTSEGGDKDRLRIALDEVRKKRKLSPHQPGMRPPEGFTSEDRVTTIPFGDEVGSGASGFAGGDGGSGPAASAGSAFFDSQGYDITPWAKRVVYRIKQNWIFPPAVSFGIQGQVEILFVIERNGRISSLRVIKGASIQPFDQSAINALVLSVPFPPFPGDFPNADITAYVIFRYN